ncbi:zinc ribbon domain-containing protein [Anaerostipes sp.]|jgi:hypothetical protein|uniref:zinc ribbon domain-containing protein n=1 Tax=Anaerostipes sp. TaxID=1872530 RepID=UPI003967269E
MFCSNCGAELNENSNFCSNCGQPVVSNNKVASTSSDEEIAIKEGLCNRVKSKLFVQNGHGLLTNKRFIYSKHSFAKIAVMGVLVNLTKGSYDFDIPISDIKEIKDGRQGISKTIIICTKSGEEYNFYFKDREKWLFEFKNIINKYK